MKKEIKKQVEEVVVEKLDSGLINQPKLDLACGQNKTAGYFGIDSAEGEGIDAVINLELFPWAIESDSAEEIVCNHYIEHIPHSTLEAFIIDLSKRVKSFEEFQAGLVTFNENMPSDGLNKFMNEIYRILKPGGKIKIVSPYYTSMRCWQDPTHTRAINEATFYYFNKGWRDTNKLDHYLAQCDFDFEYFYNMPNDIAMKANDARNFSMRHYNNSINDIVVTMTKRKKE